MALEYIEQESGKLFDPHVTKVFLKKIAPYPVGTDVELSNGYRGLVVENYPEAPSRPSVKVQRGEDEIRYFDLKNDDSLKEVEIIGVGY